MRSCAVCLTNKQEIEFALNPSAKSGLSNKCRECFNAQVRSRYTTDDRRRHHLKYRFGLTIEDYDTMLNDCDGVCPACKRALPLHIDHDHGCCPGKQSCGKCIRGLLCGPCNRALGLLREDKDAIKGLAAYLEGKGF